MLEAPAVLGRQERRALAGSEEQSGAPVHRALSIKTVLEEADRQSCATRPVETVRSLSHREGAVAEGHRLRTTEAEGSEAVSREVLAVVQGRVWEATAVSEEAGVTPAKASCKAVPVLLARRRLREEEAAEEADKEEVAAAQGTEEVLPGQAAAGVLH